MTSTDDSTEKIATDQAKVVETPSKPGEQLRRKKDLESHFRTLQEKFNHVRKTRLQHFMERVYEGVDKALLKEIVREFNAAVKNLIRQADTQWQHSLGNQGSTKKFAWICCSFKT